MESPRFGTVAALLLGLGTLLGITGGCSSSDPRVTAAGKPERGRDGTVAFLIEVAASEPGVRIEADGDSVGEAPLTLKVFGDKDGTFHNFGSPEYTVRAYPTRPGQRVQTKSYGTGAWFAREDRIPSKIYFDMDLVSDGTGAAPTAPAPSQPAVPVPSNPGPAVPTATGTAFAITAEGDLITNHHVVQDARRILIRFPDERVEARLVAKDLRNDLAVLKVVRPTVPLPLGDSATVRLGEEVGALGFPRPDSQGTRVKFNRGTISSLTGIQDDVGQFQVSVPLQPGNSGGPLLNTRGEIVGIVVGTLVVREGSVPQNVNYAVKTAYLQLLLQTVPNLAGLPPSGAPRPARPFEELLETAVPSVVLVEAYR